MPNSCHVMAAPATIRSVARTAWNSDLAYSFRRSKVTVVAGVITLVYLLAALFAPWVAPHDPYDLASVSILDSFLPPAWLEGGDARFLLGTDNVGRDVLSTIIHGSRISLGVGFASVFMDDTAVSRSDSRRAGAAAPQRPRTSSATGAAHRATRRVPYRGSP